MSTKQANPWAALSALCIGFFMVLLDMTIVSVAIPAMLRELNASLNAVVWVTSVYLLTYAVPMLVTSRLGDRFGPKRMFLLGLVVFTGASLWCGLSGTVELLIAARAVQGLGAAIMTPQTLAFITHLFPPARRGTPMGAWGGVAGLATVAGPLLGGVLVDRLGWEWIFFVNVPIGVIAIVMTLILVPDWQPRNSHSFDVPGILLSCGGLLLLVFGIQNGKQYDWGEVTGGITIPEIIVAGAVLLIAFVVWQRYNTKEPLLPLRLFASRNFSTGSIAAATIGFTMIGMFLPLVIYIQSVLGFSPTKAGAVTAPMSLLSGIIAPFIGRLSDRISGKFIAMFGLVILAVGLGIIALQAEPDMNAWKLVPALLVCGIGVGCVFSPLSNVTMSAVEPRLGGAASGVFNTSRQVGGVIGSAAVGVLLQATASHFIRSAAQDRAGALPERFRASFVESMSNSGGASEFGGGATGPTLPPDTPSSVAAKIGQVATDTFHAGFTDATRVTLLLPIAVLLLGSVACMFMRRTARRAPVPAAVGAESTVELATVPLAEERPPERTVAEQPAERTVELPAVRTGERLVHGTVRLAGGREVAGVALTLVDSTGRQIGRTSSGSDGSYTLDIGEAGNYVLIASAPAYSPVAEPISVNGQPIRLDLALSGAAGVEGTVRVGEHGDTLADAVVTLVDGRGEIVAAQHSDAEGRYALIGLAAGGYTLVVSAPGRAPVAVAVQLTAGAGMLCQDVVLQDVGGLRGVARTARDARPVPEVMITVVDAAGHVVSSTLTGESGEYTVDELPEGEYTVIASGYPPVASRVRLNGGDNPDHDIQLEHQLPTSVG